VRHASDLEGESRHFWSVRHAMAQSAATLLRLVDG
jgi:hypothetical protein